MTLNGLISTIRGGDKRYVVLVKESYGTCTIELGLVTDTPKWWRGIWTTEELASAERIEAGIIKGSLSIDDFTEEDDGNVKLVVNPQSSRRISLPLIAYTDEESASKADRLLFEIADNLQPRNGTGNSRLYAISQDAAPATSSSHADSKEIKRLTKELEAKEAEVTRKNIKLAELTDRVRRARATVAELTSPPRTSPPSSPPPAPSRSRTYLDPSASPPSSSKPPLAIWQPRSPTLGSSSTSRTKSRTASTLVPYPRSRSRSLSPTKSNIISSSSSWLPSSPTKDKISLVRSYTPTGSPTPPSRTRRPSRSPLNTTSKAAIPPRIPKYMYTPRDRSAHGRARSPSPPPDPTPRGKGPSLPPPMTPLLPLSLRSPSKPSPHPAVEALPTPYWRDKEKQTPTARSPLLPLGVQGSAAPSAVIKGRSKGNPTQKKRVYEEVQFEDSDEEGGDGGGKGKGKEKEKEKPKKAALPVPPSRAGGDGSPIKKKKKRVVQETEFESD